jgi:hypothetical protein
MCDRRGHKKRVAMSKNDDAALIQNEHPVRGDA